MRSRMVAAEAPLFLTRVGWVALRLSVLWTTSPPPPLSVWPWPPVRLLTSLTQQPSFPFQSQTHECRKLITPHQGEVDAEESLGETEREMERRVRNRMSSRGLFHLFCSSKSALSFIPLSFTKIRQWMALQTMLYPEWHKFISVAAPWYISTEPRAIYLGTIWFP